MAVYFTPFGIYTPFGMTPIKREIPNFVAKPKEGSRNCEPSRFQRNWNVKVKISKYNAEAGNLPL